MQGRKALLIDKTDSHLIDIPALNADDVLCTRTIHADLNTLKITLTGHEKGENYELTSYLIGNIDKNTTDKYIRRNILSGSYELLDFKIEQPSRDTPSTTLKASLKLHNLSKMYGNNIIITPFAIDIPTYENPNKRKTDVQLDYPQYYKDTIVYDIGDKKINKIPTNADMHTPFGHYSYKFGIADSNKIVVYKEVLIHAGRYSSDQYFGFYTFMQSLKTNENKNIYIEVQ